MQPFRSNFAASATFRAAVLLLVLAVGAIAGCSDDDNPPTGPGGSTSVGFTGMFVSGNSSGKMTLAISGSTLAGRIDGQRAARAGAHDVTATAVLMPTGSSNVSLVGTYSDEKDSLYLSGGGYVLIGHYDDSVQPHSMTGSLTGPGGDGIFGCFLGGSTTIKIYCGTYQSTAGPATGTWNMVTIDTALVGVAFPSGGNVDQLITFEGTVERTGTGTRAIAFSGGNPGVLDLTGTGTLNTISNAVAGTWALDDVNNLADDSGTWNGVLCP
jgi:hypothetical protein